MNPQLTTFGIPALDFEVGILTPREIEVMQRALLPHKNIAYDLGISYHTIISHITNIKNKTGLMGTNEMCYFLGTRQGLIN